MIYLYAIAPLYSRVPYTSQTRLWKPSHARGQTNLKLLVGAWGFPYLEAIGKHKG